MTDNLLTPGEILLLIEALDAFVPARGGHAWGMRKPWTEDDKERFRPYAALRLRLRHQAGMGFYDEGRTFLDSALREELYELTDKLHARMSDLLKQPGLTCGQFRAGMVAALQDLRDVRHYQVRMPD
jgi:hypothetical protein